MSTAAPDELKVWISHEWEIVYHMQTVIAFWREMNAIEALNLLRSQSWVTEIIEQYYWQLISSTLYTTRNLVFDAAFSNYLSPKIVILHL